MFFNGISYNVSQVNGQLICMDIKGHFPDTSELFITNIPKDVRENVLMSILSKFGNVYKFRLMMEFSGENRGYGFAIFHNENSFHRALEGIPLISIQGYRLKATASRNCNLLLIENVSISNNDLVRNIINKTEPSTIVIILEKNWNKSIIVEYATHRSAALSRRSLICILADFGKRCYLKWKRD